MQILIHLIHYLPFGDHEEFEVFRKTPKSQWRVTFSSDTMSALTGVHENEDITGLYDPEWLTFTIDQLAILELKSSAELEIPLPEDDDAETYRISILRGKSEEVIYYFNYDELVSKDSDVWRADTFWKLLRYPILEGDGIDLEEGSFEL